MPDKFQEMPDKEIRDIALVLSGGLGLGAYQGGVYEALHDHYRSIWIAGSSVGAVNAAIIAGNKSEDRIDRLREFWMSGAFPTLFAPSSGPLRHLVNWSTAVQARLFGTGGHFRPRIPPYHKGRFQSFYSLRPMRERLEKLIDFGRLNSGEIRVTVVTTDIESGEMVTFDTAQSGPLELDHVLASCRFLPELAPMDIGGRILGDGGLSSNAPIELVANEEEPPRLIFLADLFAREGKRPIDLLTAIERKSDLLFANQTYMKLEALRRRARDDRPSNTRVSQVVHLSYRSALEEAGSEKSFDYSRRTLDDRWQAGKLDCEEARRRLCEPVKDTVISIRRMPEAFAA